MSEQEGVEKTGVDMAEAGLIVGGGNPEDLNPFTRTESFVLGYSLLLDEQPQRSESVTITNV